MNSDGTYAILFDDGEKKKYVSEDEIKGQLVYPATIRTTDAVVVAMTTSVAHGEIEMAGVELVIVCLQSVLAGLATLVRSPRWRWHICHIV